MDGWVDAHASDIHYNIYTRLSVKQTHSREEDGL